MFFWWFRRIVLYSCTIMQLQYNHAIQSYNSRFLKKDTIKQSTTLYFFFYNVQCTLYNIQSTVTTLCIRYISIYREFPKIHIDYQYRWYYIVDISIFRYQLTSLVEIQAAQHKARPNTQKVSNQKPTASTVLCPFFNHPCKNQRAISIHQSKEKCDLPKQ